MSVTREAFEKRANLLQELAFHAMLCLGFAALCLLTSLFVGTKAGDSKVLTIPPEGTSSPIPFSIEAPNSVYQFKVRQSTSGLPLNTGWASASVRLLDPEGNLLFGFGDEFWRAAGRDSEGYSWSERQNEYSLNFTFPLAGEYLLEVETESSTATLNEPVYLEMTPVSGSKVPFYIGAFIGVIAAVGVGAVRYFVL